MNVHEQFADDLVLYALNSLAGEEKSALENHLESCASCRRELEQLRGDGALLALTAAGPAPPARAKVRLMNAIAQEPGSRAVASERVPKSTWSRVLPWFAAAGWIGVAALIAFVAVIRMHNEQLRKNALELSRYSAEQAVQLEQAARVAETLTASDAMHVTVLPVNYKTPPPEGRAIYSRERAGLVFVASNLRPLPANKAYELWLIPTQGAPVPAGVFKPDAHGSATVVNPPLPQGIVAKAFAITIEPEGGSQNPTLPIVMIGSGG